jgi:hypothetical protein
MLLISYFYWCCLFRKMINSLNVEWLSFLSYR